MMNSLLTLQINTGSSRMRCWLNWTLYMMRRLNGLSNLAWLLKINTLKKNSHYYWRLRSMSRAKIISTIKNLSYLVVCIIHFDFFYVVWGFGVLGFCKKVLKSNLSSMINPTRILARLYANFECSNLSMPNGECMQSVKWLIRMGRCVAPVCLKRDFSSIPSLPLKDMWGRSKLPAVPIKWTSLPIFNTVCE